MEQQRQQRFQMDKEMYAKLDGTRAKTESVTTDVLARLDGAEALVTSVKAQYVIFGNNMWDSR